MPRYHYESLWDPVTRAWHWLLALSVITGWLLGEFRTFSIMQWHLYAGYCTGILLLFRLYWGIKGPDVVRFKVLLPGPSAVFRYLKQLMRREPSGMAGHSPLGALATLVLLCLLVIQVCTGLFSEDDALFHEGPLADTVPSSLVSMATGIHSINSRLLLIMFGLHISVMIFYYIWKKENLVIAMFTGSKLTRTDAGQGSD